MSITFGEAATKRSAMQKQIADKRAARAIALKAARTLMTAAEYDALVAEMNADRVQIAVYADGIVLTRAWSARA
jgi:hypothetical protein